MQTVTRETKAGKITRKIDLGLGASKRGELVVSVVETKGAKITVSIYYLRRVASDFGTAFECEKTGGEVYDVLLAGHESSCTCKWNTFKPNSKPCRHLAMAQQAIDEQKL